MYKKQKEKGEEKHMKKRIISVLLCGILVWNLSGTSLEAAGGRGFSGKGSFHGKKVEKHLKYKDLKGTSKTKIDYAKKSCRTDGKNAAKQINGLKNDRETFEIGVKEVLDEYYGEETLELQKQEEFDTFVQEIDDAALEIVEHYEEAAMERENAENLPYETEKVLVSFPYGTDWETIETIVENEAVGYEVIDDGEYHINENLPDYKKKRVERLKDIKKDMLILADVELEDTVERAKSKFEQYACVNYVASNVYLEADGTVGNEMSGFVTTNDPKFNNKSQWHLEVTNVAKAWQRFDSAYDVYDIWVAVIDNGVQMEHPDLKGVLMRDLSVDVTNGNKRLVKYTSAEIAAGKQYTGNHGTAVTGVIAAEANNGTLGAGAASIGTHKEFRNNIKIMAIKCDTDKTGRHITTTYLAKAINYAVENAAEVINISYSALKSEFSSKDFEAIRTAIANAIFLDTVVVCAAGNDGSTTERYPAAFPGVIGVGAVNYKGKLTDYTNQSKAVDIVAPSSDASVEKDYKYIYTTKPTTAVSGGYGASGRTSCATPQVSAAVAMMLSLNYYLTPEQILTRLKIRNLRIVPSTKNPGQKFYQLDTGKAVSLTNSK